MANRYSQMSTLPAAMNTRPGTQQLHQVSTTTLLNTLHNVYSSGQSFPLDASTSLVVNTWTTARNPDAQGRTGGFVDDEIAVKAWEHARRRAEDGCIVLASAHPSTPSLFTQFLRIIPVDAPDTLFTALTAIRPFLTCITPANAATSRHSSIAATYTLSLAGKLTGLKLAISTSGIDVEKGLLHIPSEQGYRAFDVFYYLCASTSTAAEREVLGLKPLAEYALLNSSSTYDPPAYLPTADDAASAEDFRNALKAIGIKGESYRGLLAALAALLKLGDTLGFLIDSDQLEEICEDVGGLIGIEPEVLLKKCSTDDRQVLIAGIYEALVDWVFARANQAILVALRASASGKSTPDYASSSGDEVSVTILEVPGEDLGKAIALRGVFDDTLGINAEMKGDGVEVIAAGVSVLKEMQTAVTEVEADLGVLGGPISREREHDRDRRRGILERIGVEAEQGGFLRTLLYPTGDEALNFGIQGRFDLAATLASSRVWYHLSLHPTDDTPASLAALPTSTSAWSAAAVSRQLRAWRLPEWANRRNKNLDFTADFDVEEFVTRYARLGCKEARDGVETFILERGWSNGEVVLGHERIWMHENAWWEAEAMLDMKPLESNYAENPFASGYSAATPHNGSGFFPPMDAMSVQDSRENLLGQGNRPQSIAPTLAKTVHTIGGDYGLGPKGDQNENVQMYYDAEFGKYTSLDPEIGEPKRIESKTTSKGRQAWVSFVWAMTFLIPSVALRVVGRMKRPDIRMAWREKVVLVMLIFLFNAIVIFYIVAFSRLLCPNFDKAWNAKEVGYHQGTDDYYVSIFGKVYDMTKFYKIQHSDMSIKTDADNMMPYAGLNLDAYFPPPLSRACPGFDVDDSVLLQYNDTSAQQLGNVHTSGAVYQSTTTTALHSWDWFGSVFLPAVKDYYKGALVVSWSDIQKQANNDQRSWVVINNGIYDLTDYLYTIDQMNGYSTYKFLPDEVTELFQKYPGTDVSDKWGSSAIWENSLNCLNNAFYKGQPDFRKTARCQANNYILLAFTIILCSVILTKFLAALQLGSKRRPSPQDKFVICQVPAYTEGEEHLRKSLDSLTALQYDNKRKLICVICDGMVVGGGNDRPTPKIVLDILNVDPKIDPPALPFRSVGAGNQQLNYGKVYSGLYEFEGNVVPYLVIVKVGKESEQSKSKPGNRGKRDSQILLMQFLNRVHHRAPMSPLELEMFHQINNVIGVDPELYEYLFMVDADTNVREDSLNRLVAACANDAKIAGICGETSLENEEGSWWTMIQVYEYYISHHLAKAFESLFGSVTCLPGCFCMYRLRTADKGKPLIISDKVIHEYADCDVDTLHKKNLLSLGEDRYLTTLMTKHFPHMSYKFVPDAYALTAAPDTWSVLLSQRRRWINSTVHNLAELVWLKDLCGFCCFSMRFVVFLDLFGTIILPATCVYLGYLIYNVASGAGQFPLISIIMIAAVYGLQAIIFIIKRQWQHVGWMIIYILAYPIYSFVLPIYSFWKQDDFSWGNTRIVIGEKGDKKIVIEGSENFDPRSIPLQTWDDYATRSGLPGRRGEPNGGYQEKGYAPYSDDPGVMEMDDMHSVYSSVKPTSTILNNFGHQHSSPYMVPPQSQSPMPYMTQRTSTMSGMNMYKDQPVSMQGHDRHNSMLSMGSAAYPGFKSPSPSPYINHGYSASKGSLLGFGPNQSRTGSAMDFRTVHPTGPSDEAIVQAIREVLNEVDLDSVTKKQVRALVEQRLQAEVPAGDRRAFLDRAIDSELANM